MVIKSRLQHRKIKQSNIPPMNKETSMPPSKFMRLGSGLSNRVSSVALSCFDLGIISEGEMTAPKTVTEADILEILGMGASPDVSCSNLKV